MKEINREMFEAWLFDPRNDGREFDYGNAVGGCAICVFVRETSKYKDAWGGSYQVYLEKYRPFKDNPEVAIPAWLLCEGGGVTSIRPLTTTNMRIRYLELFPDTEREQFVPEVEEQKEKTLL